MTMPGAGQAATRRVTIADVARHAAVSKSAVSHVFNGRTDISAPIRERILAAAAQLGWRPAAASAQVQDVAQRLSLPRVRTRTAAHSPKSAAAATLSLLTRDPAPTAILYANDWLAMWGMDAVRAHGLRVPEDVSVIGYDDLPPATWTRPPLTTIHVDVAELASTAAAMLLDLVNGRRAQPSHTAAHLILRASAGPAPSRP